MSARDEDESQPTGTRTSQRKTARDVPVAKLKETGGGTVAPRGLRGQSLLPGQGAPERIAPEEVELAVLRDAETLDGSNVGRVAPERAARARAGSVSPSPTAVSVEVPRPRSLSPPFSEQPSTPSPASRSIQSGTLISIGSVDPRAPTERSLPSPRALSVYERVSYMGPEAVVDRTPPAPGPRELPPVDSDWPSETTLRPGGRAPELTPRPGTAPDSLAPPAERAPRAPHSYSPTSVAASAAHPAASAPRSGAERATSYRPPSAPEYTVHAQLDALPRAFQEDAFDLRSASTQREPLAGRKRHESGGYSALGRGSQPHVRASDPALRPMRDSASAVQDQRASVPLRWVLAGAALALLVAFLVALALRAPLVRDVAPSGDGLVSPAPNAKDTPMGGQTTFPAAKGAEAAAPSGGSSIPSSPRTIRSVAPKTAASARVAPSNSLPPPAEPAASDDPNGKRSIY